MLSADTLDFRYFIELSFNGTSFHGWQIQPGVETVQGKLNDVFSTLLNQTIDITGCGRTDSGVHAAHFMAHLDVAEELPDITRLLYRVNRFLGSDIAIQRIFKVEKEAHARYSATTRVYHYVISNRKQPFFRQFSWSYDRQLDVVLMNQGAKFLIGTLDFSSFAKLHSDTKNMICTVTGAGWKVLPGFLVFRISANRFLRNMVRSIVGTLVDVGLGKIRPEEVKAILQACDRSKSGVSVPAEGLFLTHVNYPHEIALTQPASPFQGLSFW